VLTTFAFISAVVEALNGNGAALSANQSLPQYKQDIGHALFKAALLIQIFVVGAFMLLAGVFHRRTIKAGIRNKNLTNALVTLYVSTVILTIRTIYRVVEYFSIADLHYDSSFDPMTLSPLIRYEWWFYVFEASLMLCNQIMMNIRHPRKYLPKSTKVYLTRDGTEVTGPGYKDSRRLIVTLLDPFDLWGLVKGREKESRFWESNGTDNETSAARDAV